MINYLINGIYGGTLLYAPIDLASFRSAAITFITVWFNKINELMIVYSSNCGIEIGYNDE